MKTKFIVVLFLAIGAFGFAQKKTTMKPALKAAAKALKSGNMDIATEALQAAEGLLDAADDKMKAQYYFFKGQVVASSASESLEKIESAANAYNKTIEIEKATGGSKYTVDATQKLQLLRQSLIENAIKDQNAKNYKGASEKLYLGYTTNKADTTYLYYAASNAVNDKDYDTALKYYKELKSLGFSGVKKEFVATHKETGKVDVFESKQIRDLSVKTGEYIKPETKTSESRKGEIAKNIALIYMSQGKDEEAIAAIEDAKKENPEDPALKQAEADVYYKLGNIAKYKEIMEQIVANDPENPDLLYNLGVSASRLGDNDQALGYYKKALELKPDYTAAQINIASIILSGETKIVDEMNSLGTSSSDNRKYDELTKKRSELYKTAVPYLEGALKSNPDNVEAIRTLMNIFYQLDDPKAGEMKDRLKALEGGN